MCIRDQNFQVSICGILKKKNSALAMQNVHEGFRWAFLKGRLVWIIVVFDDMSKFFLYSHTLNSVGGLF